MQPKVGTRGRLIGFSLKADRLAVCVQLVLKLVVKGERQNPFGCRAPSAKATEREN